MTYFKKTCTASCLHLHNREPKLTNLPESIINRTTNNWTTNDWTTNNWTTNNWTTTTVQVSRMTCELVGATTVCLPILNCPVWDGLFLLNSKMVLILLSFPFLLRQIVQSLPEVHEENHGGWFPNYGCFQIVGVPSCECSIVNVPNCGCSKSCSTRQIKNRTQTRVKERTRKNAKK